MEFSLTPSHKELFNTSFEDPQSLLQDYNSKDILIYLSLINAYLFLNNENSQKTQDEILVRLTDSWPKATKDQFLPFIHTYVIKTKEKPNFFKSLYITYFIHHELLNFKTGRVKELDGNGQFAVIKAYFAYIENFNNEFSQILENNGGISDEFSFQRNTWPFLIRQFDSNESVDPLFQALCTGMMLEHFYFDNASKDKVIAYLSSYNRNSVWQFVFDLIEIIKISFEKNTKYNTNNFAIKSNSDFQVILDQYSLSIDEYNTNTSLQLDQLGIRKKPLLKIDQDVYLVLNWKFLYRSVYLGTFFDFKERAGMKYNIVKSIIGKKVLEERLFRNLFSYMWQTHNCILHFPENEDNGFPDCYLRIGKYIFLIEFKDYLAPTDIVSSESFEKIKSHLDRNFVENDKHQKKGIKQLLAQITKLNTECFVFDNYESAGFKKRNIIICPVIVTTGFHYQMPGINSYLSEKLSTLLSEEINLDFKRVLPLTMIDFQFLFRQFNRIRKKEIDLKEIILSYQERIRNYKNEYKKQPNLKNTFKLHSSFAECLPANIKNKTAPQKESDFTENLFNAFSINPENSTF